MNGDDPEDNLIAPHTRGHRKCPACSARAQEIMLEPLGLRYLSVQEAGNVWQQMRAMKNLKPATHEHTAEDLRALARFFGDLPLGAITPGHLREYQEAREKNELRLEDGAVIHPWKRCAGNSCINHELNALKQMLELAGLWDRVRPWYSPRPIPNWSPREIPNADEEARLFQKALEDPGAQLAMWIATITANTSASGSELRYMRLRHLQLRSPLEGRSMIWIPEEGTKNNARPRRIPLNESARWAFEQCYARALAAGCKYEDDFLFPFRINRKTWDPARPATRSWLRKSWARLRDVTGLPKLSPHDLRHLFCSRMLEAGERPEVVRALMGHKTQKMTDYYSHVELEPKMAAVDRLEMASLRKPPARERRMQPRDAEMAEHLDVIPLRGSVR